MRMIGKPAANMTKTSKRRGLRRALRLTPMGLLIAAGAALQGCHADSFLDPSVVGYCWKEETPNVVPILDRLSAIEDEPTEYVQTSPPLPSDLVPEVDTYHISPGDAMDVHIQDYIALGKEEIYERLVDSRGFIDIPRLPPVRAAGLNSEELTTAIEQAIRDRQIIAQPVVAINLKTCCRKQTFSRLGRCGPDARHVHHPQRARTIACWRDSPPRGLVERAVAKSLCRAPGAAHRVGHGQDARARADQAGTRNAESGPEHGHALR